MTRSYRVWGEYLGWGRQRYQIQIATENGWVSLFKPIGGASMRRITWRLAAAGYREAPAGCVWPVAQAAAAGDSSLWP